jgi:hypothetical protein
MAGQTVCPSHGGRAPQNLNAARRRLEEAVPSLINELLRISESGKSERDRISAIKDALDRAGVGQQKTQEVVVYHVSYPE